MYREATVTGRKSGLKSTIWNTRKEKAFNQNGRNKKIQNNEDRLRNLWDNFKRSNI